MCCNKKKVLTSYCLVYTYGIVRINANHQQHSRVHLQCSRSDHAPHTASYQWACTAVSSDTSQHSTDTNPLSSRSSSLVGLSCAFCPRSPSPIRHQQHASEHRGCGCVRVWMCTWVCGVVSPCMWAMPRGRTKEGIISTGFETGLFLRMCTIDAD